MQRYYTFHLLTECHISTRCAKLPKGFTTFICKRRQSSTAISRLSVEISVQIPGCKVLKTDFQTNVLVTEDGVAKIGDFGGAKRLGETNTGLTTAGLFQATVAYTAPEIIRDGINQTLQSDVYAFALVALGKQL